MDISTPQNMVSLSKSYTSLQIEKIQAKEYRNVPRLVATVLSLCLSTFYFGYSLAYLSSVQSSTLESYFNINPEKIAVVTGNLIACLPFGAIFGAALSPLLMKLISRKQFLLCFNAGAIIIAGIVQINNLIVLYFVRFFTGLLIGGFMALTPVYINQLVPVQIQGSFGAFTQLIVVFGVMFCYLIGLIFQLTGVSVDVGWRILFSFTGLTAFFQSILLIINFIPQSPVSLIELNRMQQAKKVILMFHVPQVLDKVFSQVAAKANKNEQIKQSQIQTQRPPSKLDEQKFQIPVIPLAMFLGFQLPFLQQMTGASVVGIQIGSIVAQYDPSLVLYTPLIANTIQFTATAFSVLALSYFGRRTLLLFGTVSIAIIDILIGIFFLLLELYDWKPYVIMALVSIMIFMILFGLTLGPVVWLFVPEIIPPRFVPFATCINWIGCSFTLVVAPIIMQATNSTYPIFFMLGGYCLIFSILNFFTLVETKGLSLVEISKKMMKLE